MAFKVIKQDVLRENNTVAGEIRRSLAEKGIFMMNIISSPGAGKTSFLERTGPLLKKEGIPFVILAGDCFTSKDAERIDSLDLPVVQINTGNACHIDAQLVKKALDEVDLDKTELVIVENVGNLVCPAEFDVGEDMKIAVMSTPEGHDKPSKYPLLIEESGIVLINKTDLIKYTDFDIESCERDIRSINPGVKILRISCRTGEGIDDFLSWLKLKLSNKKGKKNEIR
ncbi:MAG: hydrogenase nickel incorporation protein HypB [Candidatus Omnitrophota bacterium]